MNNLNWYFIKIDVKILDSQNSLINLKIMFKNYRMLKLYLIEFEQI